MLLARYIEQNYGGGRGSLSRFAESQGVARQQVDRWISQGIIVIDGAMYSRRKEILKNG